MTEAPFKLSICVPIYNSGDYIERCAISLFNQSYTNIEYVFVNDCTKDNSMLILDEVISRYPQKRSQIKIINHQSNQGLAGARLTGLNNSTGDYVWFVDSDDSIDEKAVEKLSPYMAAENDLIIFSYIEEQPDKNIDRQVCNASVDKVLIHAISPSIWKCVTKRHVFFDNEILPKVGLNYMEDFFLLSRLILVSHKVVTLENDYLYYYNCTNLNSMMQSVNLRAMEQCAMVVKLVADFYQRKGAGKKYKRALQVMLGRRYLDLYRVDRNNKYCLELRERIKLANSSFSLFLSSPLPSKIKYFVIWAISMMVLKQG